MATLQVRCLTCLIHLNNLDTIPAPLPDGTKFLEVFRHVFEEKEVITSRYLGWRRRAG
jgi:ATP-dependent Lon protease